MRTLKSNSNIAVDKKQQQKQQQPLHTHKTFWPWPNGKSLERAIPTSKTPTGMGTSFESSDFFYHLGGQKSVMIGR